jgi:DedD protein
MSLEGPLAAGRQRDDDLRKRLTIRIAIAIALILGTVLALEWLDRLQAPGASTATATKPVDGARERAKVEPVVPAPPAEAVPQAGAPEKGPETAAAVEPAAKADAPTVESIAETKAAPADSKATAARASDREPVLKLSEPPAPQRAREPMAVAPPVRENTAIAREKVVPPPVRENTAIARDPAPAPAKPAEPVAAAKPAEPVQAKVGARGFQVQMGVFQSSANAEELRVRLTANGIPAYTETRVHVGPFKDRAEAERMREKLKAMGMPGLIQPAP